MTLTKPLGGQKIMVTAALWQAGAATIAYMESPRITLGQHSSFPIRENPHVLLYTLDINQHHRQCSSPRAMLPHAETILSGLAKARTC